MTLLPDDLADLVAHRVLREPPHNVRQPSTSVPDLFPRSEGQRRRGPEPA